MADAFATTFTWALVLVGLAFLPALLLPRHRPEPVEDDDGTPAEALMVHA